MAYTFVTPEEGPELTRIEQRINRQLLRDEIGGFATVDDVTQSPALVEDLELGDEGVTPAGVQASAPPPPPPPFGRRRGNRRHRRAL